MIVKLYNLLKKINNSPRFNKVADNTYILLQVFVFTYIFMTILMPFRYEW